MLRVAHLNIRPDMLKVRLSIVAQTWLYSVLCVLLVSFSVEAQEPAEPAEEQAQPGERQDLVDVAVEADAGEADPDSETDGADTDEPLPEPRSARDILIEDFDVSVDDVDQLQALETIAKGAEERARRIEQARNELNEGLLESRRIIALLERQVRSSELPREAQTILLRDLVVHTIDEARSAGEIETFDAILGEQRQLEELADRHSEALETIREVEEEERETSQERIDEAEEAHQDALQRVADAMRREREERDQEIRQLLTQERELAEDLAELTRREGELVRELDSERRRRADDFAEERSELNAEIVDLPSTPDEDTAREQVDPLFQVAVDRRRRARSEFYEHLGEVEEAAQEVQRLQELYQSALEQFESFQHADVDDNERIRRRHSIAQLQANLAEHELRMASDAYDAHQQKSEMFRDRVEFYHETVGELFPLISRQQQNEFLSLRRDENWHDAFDDLRDAGFQVRLRLRERAQALASPSDQLLSVAFWLWLFGLLWRLLLLPIAFFVGREYSPRLVRFVTDALLRRRFFRRHAAFTVKGGELLGAMIKPALLFVATIFVVEYAAIAWQEFYLLRWAINAVFIYWMVMIAIKVLVLPRGYRDTEDLNLNSQSSSESDDADQVEDLIDMELSRAMKIVVSTRVVLIFWLLAFYVPALVLYATGHNVVWRIVERLAVWGLLAVVYAVLSTWRNDIARIFDRLASERMPRAVTIVQEHKNRPWGVLLIGLASVYVVVREGARLGRAYFNDTKWHRRITNFFFRKSIELQQRDRDAEEIDVQGDLPADYKAWFEDRPLVDEPYAIERTHLIERIEESLDQWREYRRKGAVAVVAEQGLGKTTLLNQIYERWHQEDDRDVAYMQLNDKISDCPDVYEFLASFLGIESAPEDPRGLAQAMLEEPSRIVVIDDCHHIFMRQIGGFEAIDLFLSIVKRTDHHHFWLLSFNSNTWSYLNRVRYRGHFFSDVINLEGWSESEIQEMIENRNDMDPLPISFTELVVAHGDDRGDQHYEIVRTSKGYFRLLHEFAKGNPRVALTFWLRSLHLDATSTIQVELFSRPSLKTLKSLSKDDLFALAAIAQHESLRPDEIATIIHAYEGDCEMIVEYLTDSEIIEIDPVFRRARIRSLFLRSVMKTLQDANVLYT